MKKNIVEGIKGILKDDAKSNIDENRERWGKRELWEGKDNYGYQWGGGHKQSYFEMRRVAESYLIPFMIKESNDILEIAPGAGRMTTELLRLARRLVLVDVNSACIDVCRERFKYYNHIEYHVNDGISLDTVKNGSCDLIVSWDSFVHMDKNVVEGYIAQFGSKLRDNGFAWVHHSGAGKAKKGWRSNVTREIVSELVEKHGLLLKAQINVSLVQEPEKYYRDCVSVMVKNPTSDLVGLPREE
jgi:cyclopropane fatty-acyl-phospholipid synthase-like methyltransferase